MDSAKEEKHLDSLVQRLLREHDPAGSRVDFLGAQYEDRKSVVEGKSVDLGGRRIIKKKSNAYMRLSQLHIASNLI